MNLQISSLIFASVILFIPFIAIVRKVPVFENFTEGGKHGFELIVKIIPFIVGMLVATGMLRASGFFTLVQKTFEPSFSAIGFPSEILPLALLRPVTGSGSIALLIDIVEQYGPNSMAAKIAATLLGSTETTFYIIAIYFGAVNIKRYRHAVATGLIAEISGTIAAIIVCKILFS